MTTKGRTQPVREQKWKERVKEIVCTCREERKLRRVKDTDGMSSRIGSAD